MTRVVVAGGGLAGIAAALECADMGASVTLLERRRQLGGLTRSFRHAGLDMDNGQHVFLACCDEYRRFVRRIGGESDLHGPHRLDVPVVAPGPAPVVGRLRRSGFPAPLHLTGALLRYPHLPRADRLRLARAVAGLRRLDPADPALDGTTFGEWLVRHGQSPAAIEAVWDLITVPTVNLPAAEASLALAAMVFRTGLLSRPDAADIGWAAVPLGRLHGDRAAAALERAGVEVITGATVDAVRPARGWDVMTSDGPLEADAVVVALPHEEAARVVPPGAFPSRGRWPELGSSAVTDVHLVFDRRVMSWPVMTGLHSGGQWVFDRSAAAGLDPGDGQYLAVSLSASDHLLDRRPDVIVADTVASLAGLLPLVRGARLLTSLVTKERRATFRGRPGTLAARPGPAAALEGLALAGAWTATGWPATMEGAVRSGRAAAAALAPCIRSPRTKQEVA